MITVNKWEDGVHDRFYVITEVSNYSICQNKAALTWNATCGSNKQTDYKHTCESLTQSLVVFQKPKTKKPRSEWFLLETEST